MPEQMPDRRSTLKFFGELFAGAAAGVATGAVGGLLMDKKSEPKEQVRVIPERKPEHGDLVTIDSILKQEVPAEYLEKVRQTMRGKTGVLISKKYNRLFLFNGGDNFIFTAVAMHANPYHTMNNIERHAHTPNSDPAKPFTINRIHGKDYRSSQVRDAAGQREKMYYPMFYDLEGRAIHGIETSISNTGEELIPYNNSHGCINTTIRDAEVIQKILFPAGRILRGVPAPIVVIQD